MTTQEVYAKYTELYDISTDIGKNVHYKIHTPTGISHMKKLGGLYKQYKEYKYLGASIAWVPITTLPKDLAGVGYEAGDDIDPRDLINPILHKGYKGESLVTDFLSERALWTENADATDACNQGKNKQALRVPRMTESGGVSKSGYEGTSDQMHDWLRGLYYTSLTDPEWGKAHPREGFYQELFSIVRTLATTQRVGQTGWGQDQPKSTYLNRYKITDRDIESLGTLPTNTDAATTQGVSTVEKAGSFTNIPNAQSEIVGDTANNIYSFTSINQTDIFSHEFERLGWMETSGKGSQIATNFLSKTTTGGEIETFRQTDLDLNRMPKVYMYLIQTPPAYKSKQYYRMSLTHRFAFRKFRQVYGLDMPNVWSDEIYKYDTSTNLPRGQPLTISGAKMYDESGRLHDDDFEVPMYEPALENSIEADGDGVTIEKISDGVM